MDGKSSGGTNSQSRKQDVYDVEDDDDNNNGDADLQRALMESQGMNVAGMTEEEQMELAIMQSMQNESKEDSKRQEENDILEDEPPEGTANAIKLQIRLPSNVRKIRRFKPHSKVSQIYKFVKSEDKTGSQNNKSLEIRAFFPPKDIKDMMDMSIKDAGLSGEALAGRWV